MTKYDEIIKAIKAQLAINEMKFGEHCYRHSSDLALHVKTAIQAAGFQIVRVKTKNRKEKK